VKIILNLIIDIVLPDTNTTIKSLINTIISVFLLLYLPTPSFNGKTSLSLSSLLIQLFSTATLCTYLYA
jgi:hypothetical protein